VGSELVALGGKRLLLILYLARKPKQAAERVEVPSVMFNVA
jgi:hypothetical protein